MGLRLVDANHSNIVPIWAEEPTSGDASQQDAPLPEPARLYGLIVLAFLLHKPHPIFSGCVTCGKRWPCPPGAFGLSAARGVLSDER